MPGRCQGKSDEDMTGEPSAVEKKKNKEKKSKREKKATKDKKPKDCRPFGGITPSPRILTSRDALTFPITSGQLFA